jgi:hypothetical protein
MAFQTEFDFVLPKGYLDEDGAVHNLGTMRLATAADEIFPLGVQKVQQNPAYLTVILLSRVVTKLGSVKMVSTKVIEGLFAADLAYLQDFYRRINEHGTTMLKAVCPKCEHKFEMEMAMGES